MPRATTVSHLILSTGKMNGVINFLADRQLRRLITKAVIRSCTWQSYCQSFCYFILFLLFLQTELESRQIEIIYTYILCVCIHVVKKTGHNSPHHSLTKLLTTQPHDQERHFHLIWTTYATIFSTGKFDICLKILCPDRGGAERENEHVSACSTKRSRHCSSRGE